MELNRRQDGSAENYKSISGSTQQTAWYRSGRNVATIGVAVLLVIVVIVVASAFKGENESNDKEAQIPLIWDEDCPLEASQCPESFLGKPPPLLLVSLDGFRPDYLKRGFSPTLHRISRCGATADFIYPVFPTKTFPNHFSLVTGLYPPSHGIVDNSMFDPRTNKSFKLGSMSSHDSSWWLKEPIWVSVEKQGKRAATFFWPGSDVTINGTLPTYYKMYDGKIPFNDRVDQVLLWLDLPPDTRPDFMTLYFDEPDRAAHKHGIHSQEVNDSLSKVDGLVERLFLGLQQRNLTGCINVLIMSDHGMSDVSCSRLIDLQNYTDVSNLHVAAAGTFGRIRPKVAENASIDVLLGELMCQSDHMRVYRKEELPVRMHYADNPRIEPIFLELDSGWMIKKPESKYCDGGAHGYDNTFLDMRAMFMAVGPSIKKNLTVKPFLNIEVYELMCEMIDIHPNPNNGTRGSLHKLLVEPGHLSPRPEPNAPDTRRVPNNPDEYQESVEAAHCHCNQSKNQKDRIGRRDIHLPFGVPNSDTNNAILRLLLNDDYVTAYDPSILMPKWASFTVVRNASLSSEDVCWTGDARVRSGETARCTDYNSTILLEEHILQRSLFPPGFSMFDSREQASYITNCVPKSKYHVINLEKEMIRILGEWAEEGDINVLMGPAFDLFASGVEPNAIRFQEERDKYGRLLVPTHLFVVVTWCSTDDDELKNCHPSNLEAHSFLLPNHPYPRNCENATSVIEKNSARVVDVETLTGLSLFNGIPIYDAIRLRTMMPRRSIRPHND